MSKPVLSGKAKEKFGQALLAIFLHDLGEVQRVIDLKISGLPARLQLIMLQALDKIVRERTLEAEADLEDEKRE
ncbi:MAG: hypothetical protein PHI63_03325 [Patescibacteria group bacterium]|nr:hypothetical protein [Patescibacteria group bacterium]